MAAAAFYALFRAFYWCKQCHKDVVDVQLIKKCKCKNLSLFRKSGGKPVQLVKRGNAGERIWLSGGSQPQLSAMPIDTIDTMPKHSSSLLGVGGGGGDQRVIDIGAFEQQDMKYVYPMVYATRRLTNNSVVQLQCCRDVETKLFERGNFDLERANLLRLLADLRLLRFAARLRHFAACLHRFVVRLPVDILERLGAKLARDEARNEQIGDDGLADVGVVVEQIELVPLVAFGQRPAHAAAVAVYKQCVRASKHADDARAAQMLNVCDGKVAQQVGATY